MHITARQVETRNPSTSQNKQNSGQNRQTQSPKSACGCCAPPKAFLNAMMKLNAALDTQRTQHWTQPQRFTHAFQWTCRNEDYTNFISRSVTSPNALSDAEQAAYRELMASASTQEEGAASPSNEGGQTWNEENRGSLVLLGGKVFTSDPGNPWAQAVAIQDGEIVSCGSDEEVLALTSGWDDVRKIPLDGKLVIPGLNDAHMHHTPDPSGIRLPIDPVADPDFATITPMIEEAVSSSPSGTWIFGVMGITLINDKGLTRRELDTIAPDHPIILLGLTNHTNVVNTAAMALLGIDENEPDVLGGAFERYEDNTVSGRINEYAQWSPQRCFAAMATVDEGAASIQALAAEAASFGITTLQNMSWTAADKYVEMLKAADPAIRVRVIRFPPSGKEGRYLGEGTSLPKSVGPRIEVSGTKWILDGTTVERAAAMGRPYADAPETSGELNFPPTEIQEMLNESLRSGDQLLLHAIGTEALQAVLDAVHAVGGKSIDWREKGLRIEHGDGLTEAHISDLREMGIEVVQNPTHFLFPQIYGPRFGEGVLFASFSKLLKNDIPMGIGSDGPLNPFLGIMAAVIHPANPEEAISVEDAVVAYTHGSAVAEQKGDVKGRLRPGYVGDLAVLSQDIFQADPQTLPGTQSLLTVVAGHVVHDTLAV